MPRRPQLLLLPGLLNDAELWRDQVSGLADVADCHVPDLTRGTSLRELANSALSDAAPRFAVAGFSLGGYVAQEIIRVAPERIERLALLDTSIRADTPERAANRRTLNDAARTIGRFHGFGERLLQTYLHPDNLQDAAITGRIRAMTERLGPEVFLRQNAIERRDGSAALRSLSCPVLILCGERDALTPPADHREMAALVPGAKFVQIARSGHMAPIENSGEVIAALRAWLAADGGGHSRPRSSARRWEDQS